MSAIPAPMEARQLGDLDQLGSPLLDGPPGDRSVRLAVAPLRPHEPARSEVLQQRGPGPGGLDRHRGQEPLRRDRSTRPLEQLDQLWIVWMYGVRKEHISECSV